MAGRAALERLSRALRGALAGLMVGSAAGYGAIIPFFLVADLVGSDVDALEGVSLVLWLSALGLVLGAAEASRPRALFSFPRKA
jgi:hypothetical protein